MKRKRKLGQEIIDGLTEVITERRVRGLGTVLLDMEPLIQEMVEGHDLQWGDILNLIHGYLAVHYPAAQEAYVEGGSPVFSYGPREKGAEE